MNRPGRRNLTMAVAAAAANAGWARSVATVTFSVFRPCQAFSVMLRYSLRLRVQLIPSHTTKETDSGPRQLMIIWLLFICRGLRLARLVLQASGTFLKWTHS